MQPLSLGGSITGIPAVAVSRKCGRSGCVCEENPLPITAIVYGKEHPRNHHSPPAKEKPRFESPVHIQVPTHTLRKLSRKYPRVYKLVKERNG